MANKEIPNLGGIDMQVIYCQEEIEEPSTTHIFIKYMQYASFATFKSLPVAVHA